MNAIVKFAKEEGYDNVIYLNKWNGYDVYEPVFEGEEVAFVGPPLVILAKGETIRMSTVEEAYRQLDEMNIEPSDDNIIMEAAFIEIVRDLLEKRGKEVLFNATLCRAILADYTKNKFQEERDLLLQAVTSGTAREIYEASDLHTCKSLQIKRLQEDYGLMQSSAQEVVDMLSQILREDVTKTL